MLKKLCFLASCALVFTLFSCNQDSDLSKTLQGKYNVKVTKVNLEELEKAQVDVQKELEKGKKELAENLEKAKQEIDADVNIEIDGKKINTKEMVDGLEQGLGKMMEGLGDMGKGLGDLKNTITENVIKNMVFQVEFQEDGKLRVGSDNNRFNFSSKHLTWAVKDGKLQIKDSEKNDEGFTFDLKDQNAKGMELVSDKINLKLNKAE